MAGQVRSTAKPELGSRCGQGRTNSTPLDQEPARQRGWQASVWSAWVQQKTGENGMAAEVDRAAIPRSDQLARIPAVCERLAQSVGLAWRPGSEELWTVSETSGTSWATTCAGLLTRVRPAVLRLDLSTTASQWIRGSRRHATDWSAKAVKPDYATATTGAAGLAFADGRPCCRARAGAFVGCTVPGTASRPTATRWCSCPSSMVARVGSRARY